MANKRSPKKRRLVAKTVLRLPDLDQAKAAVLNSLSSRDAQRGYRHAIDEFIEWYCSEPRLSFSRTVVVRYGCIWSLGSLHPEPPICASGPCPSGCVARLRFETARGSGTDPLPPTATRTTLGHCRSHGKGRSHSDGTNAGLGQSGP